jgi:hypothetical protein
VPTMMRASLLAVALSVIGAADAAAQAGPTSPPPNPPTVPPSAPATLPTGTPTAATPVTEAPPPTVSLRGGGMHDRRLYLSWNCQRGIGGTMTLIEGGLRADKRYGTLRYPCNTGRLGTYFTMPTWMANATRTPAGARAAISVAADGQPAPAVFSLRLRLRLRLPAAAARAADSGLWDWAPDYVRAACWAGTLIGDTGSLAITVSRGANFGAPVNAHVYWRAYAWDGTRRQWLWGRLRDYYTRPYIYNGGANFVRNGEIWTPLGTGGDGTDNTPETILILPGTWVRPALAVTVAASGVNAVHYLYVTEASAASYSPGVALYPRTGRATWCGFGTS